jgi:hypothetical protein
MAFKSIHGSASDMATTCAFSMSTFYVIQGHPVHIPQGQAKAARLKREAVILKFIA